MLEACYVCRSNWPRRRGASFFDTRKQLLNAVYVCKCVTLLRSHDTDVTQSIVRFVFQRTGVIFVRLLQRMHSPTHSMGQRPSSICYGGRSIIVNRTATELCPESVGNAGHTLTPCIFKIHFINILPTSLQVFSFKFCMNFLSHLWVLRKVK
jgi:hypothetical protein